jgi:hypothetical protein
MAYEEKHWMYSCHKLSIRENIPLKVQSRATCNECYKVWNYMSVPVKVQLL